tara:strand:- start:1044 stop:1271 length:228 start_codon:yes stop_codon:yes gene_type:complete
MVKKLDRLLAIEKLIGSLNDEALSIVKELDSSGSEYDRSRLYWHAHLAGAVFDMSTSRKALKPVASKSPKVQEWR